MKQVRFWPERTKSYKHFTKKVIVYKKFYKCYKHFTKIQIIQTLLILILIL